jgi:Tfp pilus assembly protein FimT
MTLIEVLLVVALASLVLAAAAVYSVPWLYRESMRGAIYDVQTYVQLARIEAVSRNRDCRLVVDTGSGTLQVLDMNGTVNPIDDTLLYEQRLPGSVTFADPGGGAAVTLNQIGTTPLYQVRFNADGTVVAGAGSVNLFGGQRYGRISVFAAGGTQVERWSDGAWHVGS